MVNYDQVIKNQLFERPAIGDADEERQDDELRIRHQRTADEKGCQWSHDGVLL